MVIDDLPYWCMASMRNGYNTIKNFRKLIVINGFGNSQNLGILVAEVGTSILAISRNAMSKGAEF